MVLLGGHVFIFFFILKLTFEGLRSSNDFFIILRSIVARDNEIGRFSGSEGFFLLIDRKFAIEIIPVRLRKGLDDSLQSLQKFIINGPLRGLIEERRFIKRHINT